MSLKCSDLGQCRGGNKSEASFEEVRYESKSLNNARGRSRIGFAVSKQNQAPAVSGFARY
jgi:hypothetical protein